MAGAATYTAEEVDAAVEALSDPDRYGHAQEVVTHAAPGLQRVLGAALVQGGWFDAAHDAQHALGTGRRLQQVQRAHVELFGTQQNLRGIPVDQ